METEMKDVMQPTYSVLLVEDSEDDAFFFARALRKAQKLRLLWRAHDGGEAIAYLGGTGEYANQPDHSWPDVIVLDLEMPGYDGFDVLAWLQRQECKSKVFVFSGSEESSDYRKAMALGADCVMAKGVQPKELLNLLQAVERTCEERGAREVARTM